MKFPKDIISIDDLGLDHIQEIIEKSTRGDVYKPEVELSFPVGLVFQENSTRTRVSFERAAQDLELSSVLITAKGSSLEKGELLEDTIAFLKTQGISKFAVRCAHTRGLEVFRKDSQVRVLNAGDGRGEHPSQALLDLATLVEKYGSLSELKGKKMCIVGDSARSRVSRSWALLAKKIGLELVLACPEDMAPQDWIEKPKLFSSLVEALKDTEIVMGLRVQMERISKSDQVDIDNYVKNYQLNDSHLDNAKHLLHPAPVNWGVEFCESLRTHKKLRIWDQMSMGFKLRRVLWQVIE